MIQLIIIVESSPDIPFRRRMASKLYSALAARILKLQGLQSDNKSLSAGASSSFTQFLSHISRWETRHPDLYRIREVYSKNFQEASIFHSKQQKCILTKSKRKFPNETGLLILKITHLERTFREVKIARVM